MKNKIYAALKIITLVVVPFLLSLSTIGLVITILTNDETIGLILPKAMVALACIHIALLIGYGIAGITKAATKKQETKEVER